MNTKFFFSAIAMFAITSAANALPIGQHVKFPQVNEEVATSAVIRRAEAVRVNEEVATSAVIRRAEAVRVNEEVATSAVIKGAQVSGVNEEVATSAVIRRAEAVRVNEEVATSAVVKGVESKSGMELAARRGPHFPPFIVDTERAKDVAFFIFPNPYKTKRHIPTVL